MKRDVLIVGAGLSGCTLAHKLSKNGIGFDLIEARERTGGRILSRGVCNSAADTAREAVDLGPSWFWPHQHQLQQLLAELNLASHVYEQSSSGDSVIEYANGQRVRTGGAASMAGSYRLEGGVAAIIVRLCDNIDQNSIHLQNRLLSLSSINDSVAAEIQTPTGTVHKQYKLVVMAMPPRVAASKIRFENIDVDVGALNSVATWMAAEAKLVLTYETPFWLDQGLSGDAISQIGPMTEIHDATPRHASHGALFGFIGQRPAERIADNSQLQANAITQVNRLFNTKVKPVCVQYKDWAYDEFTATEADIAGQRAHPDSQLLHARHTQENIIWAGTETASSNNAGYLEGAVEAAHAAFNRILPLTDR